MLPAMTGSKNVSNKLQSNSTLFNLAWFHDIENYGQLKRVTLKDPTVLNDGHYKVILLWKNLESSLPYKKHIAVQHFNYFEKKLIRNPA